MWVTTRVSPSTTRSSSSRRPLRSSLAPLASSARICPLRSRRGPAARPAGPDSCPPALSPRPWHSRTASTHNTPLAGIPEVWLSAKGFAIEFASHPFSYKMATGCSQARAGVNGAEDPPSQSRTATTNFGRMQTALIVVPVQ